MESVTSKVYQTIKTYLRQKTYCRLTIRSHQSRPIGLRLRSWRVQIKQSTIKLQSKVNSPDTDLPQIRRRSYAANVLVFLSGGEAGLVAGSRSRKKCSDDEVCDRQSPISRQISAKDCEFRRKMMLNVHIPELLPLRRSNSDIYNQGFANLRAVSSF